jgi:hypothetical protein
MMLRAERDLVVPNLMPHDIIVTAENSWYSSNPVYFDTRNPLPWFPWKKNHGAVHDSEVGGYVLRQLGYAVEADLER